MNFMVRRLVERVFGVEGVMVRMKGGQSRGECGFGCLMGREEGG